MTLNNIKYKWSLVDYWLSLKVMAIIDFLLT